jgi:hypothetical protein
MFTRSNGIALPKPVIYPCGRFQALIAKRRRIGRLGHNPLRRLVMATGGLVVVGFFAIVYTFSAAALQQETGGP